jgi:hypothetical protein
LKLIRNLLILTTVIGFTLTGWLAGHILRFYMPASQFQHPPNEKIDPKIKNGFDFEYQGIRRIAVFSRITEALQVQVFLDEIQVKPLNGCVGNTYYTSLPAKCRSADGGLVAVRGIAPYFVVIPEDK